MSLQNDNLPTAGYVTTGGGWCIHGVPYGPNWACGQCGSAHGTTVTYGASSADMDQIKMDLRRIVELLERIAGIRR